MTPLINQWGPVAVIVVGYLLGAYFQSRSITHLDRRIDDLRDSLSRRIDDLRDTVNRRFDDSHDLLKSEVKRLDDRIERMEQRLGRIDDRLEHPIVRQS
jgi:predicted RNase H-like nuclease (RuvC/YqgF family)